MCQSRCAVSLYQNTIVEIHDLAMFLSCECYDSMRLPLSVQSESYCYAFVTMMGAQVEQYHLYHVIVDQRGMLTSGHEFADRYQ